MNDQEKSAMLWSRAGFGLPAARAGQKLRFSRQLRDVFRGPRPEPVAIITLEDYQWSSAKSMQERGIPEPRMKEAQRSFRQRTAELGAAWLDVMTRTEQPLQEKMALFWHGHFATRADNPYFDQLLLNEFRTQALGNFGTLLKAVARSPGMLKFLNNQQNRKARPNENFAREVMELFTLGRGHYSEHDVKEAARAFTGWTFNEEGIFEIRERQHDSGGKRFLGESGDFGGDEVLDIILKQEQTARFITAKIYRHFVNETPDEVRIRSLAAGFYRSNYDIGKLMEGIFSADWFYTEQNRGAQVKSPVELLVGMQRQIPFSFEQEKQANMLLRVLGQQLFYPPNVAGWAGGRDWIDASSLVIRMRLAEAIYGSRELELRAKEIDAEMSERNKLPTAADSSKEGRFRVGRTEVDWEPFLEKWRAVDRAALPRRLSDSLIATPLSDAQLTTAVRYANDQNPDAFIRSLAIRLMSLPEYQLA